MSSKKRKGDLPASSTAEAGQKTSRHVEQSTKPDADARGDGDESDHAATRIQRDEAQAQLAAALLEHEHFKSRRDAELAAALLENERLRAAASEPCARCHFYSDWTVRVRTMSGQVHTITCPDGPKTLVSTVKQKLVHFDPKCHILPQVTLVLPCEASSSSSSDPTDLALADDRTLGSYDMSKRGMLDLLLVDMSWSNACQEMIEHVKHGGERIVFRTRGRRDFIGDDQVLAISWSLVNAVCFLRLSWVEFATL